MSAEKNRQERYARELKNALEQNRRVRESKRGFARFLDRFIHY